MVVASALLRPASGSSSSSSLGSSAIARATSSRLRWPSGSARGDCSACAPSPNRSRTVRALPRAASRERLVMARHGLAVLGFSLWIKQSWMGFTFDAVADDEDAARTVGVNVSIYKLTAFGIGTALAGLAGGLYVYFARIILPDTFDFVQSIAILTMVVIGGTGSVWGVCAATVALTLLPEVSRAAADYRLLIFGAMLMLVMRFSPGGLAGLVRRRPA